MSVVNKIALSFATIALLLSATIAGIIIVADARLREATWLLCRESVAQQKASPMITVVSREGPLTIDAGNESCSLLAISQGDVRLEFYVWRNKQFHRFIRSVRGEK